ncbi:MAG: Ig-like domain-containing protein [Pricia sp.]
MYSIKKVGVILIFFYVFISIFYGCRQEESLGPVQVIYKNEKAVSVQMDYSGNPDALGVFMKGETETAILGRLDKKDGQLRFSPPVPFTPGQVYEVRKAGQKLVEFSVPSTTLSKPAEIIGIYPAQDTVPENLLKIYVQFSQPMQHAGNALEFITVYNTTEGKEESIFLSLETELWNRHHDRLTLWLDPGRIKTDLIPNREQGLPLKKGSAYTVTVDKKWKTAAGQELTKTYRKQWTVIAPDTLKPDVKNWEVDAPDSNSDKALAIYFDEPLDHELAQESIGIYGSNGKAIAGDWELNKWGTTLYFTPSRIWKKGNYEIVVNPKLEDFAGNNLNRLFDKNLEDSPIVLTEQHNYRIDFTVDMK